MFIHSIFRLINSVYLTWYLTCPCHCRRFHHISNLLKSISNHICHVLSFPYHIMSALFISFSCLFISIHILFLSLHFHFNSNHICHVPSFPFLIISTHSYSIPSHYFSFPSPFMVFHILFSFQFPFPFKSYLSCPFFSISLQIYSISVRYCTVLFHLHSWFFISFSLFNFLFHS